MTDDWEIKQEKFHKFEELFDDICHRIFNDYFHISAAMCLYDEEMFETDLSTLTAKEIIDKIRDFIANNKEDRNYIIFLDYLAHYPVSMCKREVSPLLERLIGFHYRIANPNKEQLENGAKKTSMDDLSEIFCRSKATISDYVNATESLWQQAQAGQQQLAMREKAKVQAYEDMVKEERAKLEQKTQTNDQTSEQTPQSPVREVNVP